MGSKQLDIEQPLCQQIWLLPLGGADRHVQQGASNMCNTHLSLCLCRQPGIVRQSQGVPGRRRGHSFTHTSHNIDTHHASLALMMAWLPTCIATLGHRGCSIRSAKSLSTVEALSSHFSPASSSSKLFQSDHDLQVCVLWDVKISLHHGRD